MRPMMERSTAAQVCVIVAARNAAETIAAAVGSALYEPEVAEVVVVDDGSTDGTSACAAKADDGSGRLTVISWTRNRGPAYARNRAIEMSEAPLIAILDADDFFLPGRFRHLLSTDDWDFIADNVAFIDFGDRAVDAPEITAFRADPSFLNLREFVLGNIARRGRRRGELGFLKPVMRRAFLEQGRLSYRESLRLGEDYDLYVRALARGARYKVVRTCGYGALVRSDSLSGQHRTEDLERAYAADRDIVKSELGLSPVEAAAVGRHARHLRRRFELRRFLDMKNHSGLQAAAFHALARPATVPGLATDILIDKLASARQRLGFHRPQMADAPIRYLLPAIAVSQR
jgi:succinoglycan biosynthesis protein ExoU